MDTRLIYFSGGGKNSLPLSLFRFEEFLNGTDDTARVDPRKRESF